MFIKDGNMYIALNAGLVFVYILYVDGEQCSGLYGVTRSDNFTKYLGCILI